MNCPQCGHSESAVRDSRKRDDEVYRRRQCSACGVKFSTYEVQDARHTELVERSERLSRVMALFQSLVVS